MDGSMGGPAGQCTRSRMDARIDQYKWISDGQVDGLREQRWQPPCPCTCRLTSWLLSHRQSVIVMEPPFLCTSTSRQLQAASVPSLSGYGSELQWQLCRVADHAKCAAAAP
eukprot:213747-Chlamydomonas_euryale.AAC.2